MAVARVAELVAVKVADAVVAAAVVLIVVLVVDLAAATVEAATDGGDGNNFATFSETWILVEDSTRPVRTLPVVCTSRVALRSFITFSTRISRLPFCEFASSTAL